MPVRVREMIAVANIPGCLRIRDLVTVRIVVAWNAALDVVSPYGVANERVLRLQTLGNSRHPSRVFRVQSDQCIDLPTGLGIQPVVGDRYNLHVAFVPPGGRRGRKRTCVGAH